MKKKYLYKMINAAMFLALAYVLPFLTGQIPEFGKMLCPMHLPIIMCGIICGWQWGLAVGIIAPLLRTLTVGVPVFYPEAICMAIELATYGAVAGIMYKILPKKVVHTYVTLIFAMIAGRVMWGISEMILMGIKGQPFTFSMFISGAVVNAIPGIIAQIIFIPILVLFWKKYEKSGRLKKYE